MTASRSSWSAAKLSEGLAGKYVDLYEFPDGTLEVRSKGRSRFPIVSSARTNACQPHSDSREQTTRAMHSRSSRCNKTIKREPKVQTNSEKGSAIRRILGSFTGRITNRKVHAGARGGNDGLMESVEKMKAVSHPSHSPWKPTKYGGSHITHRATTTTHYDDRTALQKWRRFSFAATRSVGAK